MKNFAYQRAKTLPEALTLKTSDDKYLGGGTSLVDLMRENIEQPTSVIDVASLPAAITQLEGSGLHVDAAVTNTALAANHIVRTKLPCLSQAILAGASGQIRNMATVAGNIMQRTRCYYFYDGEARCNKREPGSGCDALQGFNRIHAIFGGSDACIATHPSDMCVALAALEATIVVKDKDGERHIAFDEFHKLPQETPHIETALQAHELITGVVIPTPEYAENSIYRKVRDRSSYAFSLVSIAAAIDIDQSTTKNAIKTAIKTVRIALGGVAHKPWRARAAEAYLQGKEATQANFLAAADAELAAAQAYEHNAFKIELVRRLIVNTLLELTQGN